MSNSTTQQLSPPEAILTKKQKFDSQDVFKYINLGVTFILLFCVKGFLEFRQYCVSKGYYVFAVDSLIWVAVGFFFVFVIKYSYFHYMKSYIYSIINSKFEGETRDKKTRFVLKLSYDSLFYTFTTIVSFIFFRQEYWFPSIVGGCGECSKLYKDYPDWPQEKRQEVEIYFLFQLGVHAFSVFEMAVIKRKTEKKFHQYLLHHFIAVSLILFSIMSNQTVAGAMILIVHDMSDILMSSCRGFVQTKFATPALSGIGYLSLLFVWIYCRIFVFPFCLLANVWVNSPLQNDEWYMISFQYKYLLTMACVLYVMHIYWTYYLLVVGMNAMAKNKLSISNPHQKNGAD